MKRLLLAALCLSAALAQAEAFSPLYQGTRGIATCTTTSSRVALATGIGGGAPKQIEVQNEGSASGDTVFMEVGDVTIVATAATGYPLLHGNSKLISQPNTFTHAACVSKSGTQVVYFTVGRGE